MKYVIVQTAKQSCELLLKVSYIIDDYVYLLTRDTAKIIDSILDYSKLEASGNGFLRTRA